MQEIKSVEEFNTEVNETEGVVVVDFWASWCGPCKALMPTLEEVDADLDDHAKIVKVSIEDVPELAKEYGIQTIPTLLFFSDGELVDNHTGTISAQDLRDRIVEVS